MKNAQLVTLRKASGAFEWLQPLDPATWTDEIHSLYWLAAGLKKEFNFPYVQRFPSTCLDYYFVLHSGTDFWTATLPSQWRARLAEHGSCMRKCISQDSALEIHLHMEACEECKHVVHVYVDNVTLRQARRDACRSACVTVFHALRCRRGTLRDLNLFLVKMLWTTRREEAWDLVRDA